MGDEDMILTSLFGLKTYSERFRLAKVYDRENDKTLYILTNQWSWTTDTIPQLFKDRWDAGSCLFSILPISFQKLLSILYFLFWTEVWSGKSKLCEIYRYV